MNKAISILLLEDDINMSNALEDFINGREDVCLIGKTNSSYDAIKLLKKFKPEAIIVDLELNYGIGSGFEFLTELRSMNLGFAPLVVVNTNINSPSIYDSIHEGFADLIFYKKQLGYSFELVINAIVFSRKHINNGNIFKYEIDTIISEMVNYELDRIGINPKLNGRNYIFKAICYMLNEDSNKLKEVTPLQYVANIYDTFSSSIGRDIQTAINNAWKNTPVEDLELFYTAKYSINTGVPTAMELISYYYNKIKEEI